MLNHDRKYKVAVLNYPLLDPKQEVSNIISRLELDYSSHDDELTPLYIHIPFCSSTCSFCIYSRQVCKKEDPLVSKYVEALVKEIKNYAQTPYVKSLKIGSIFLGGGTPTFLSTEELVSIIQACKDNLNLVDDIEITVECNIANADHEKLEEIVNTGVNRLSIGLQTFNNKHRKNLGLASTQKVMMEWLNQVSRLQLNDVSIDLLYGLPGQTESEWLEDIETALALPITHFSIYELIAFGNTVLDRKLKDGKLAKLPNSETLFEMYKIAHEQLKEHSFHNIIVPEYNKSKDVGFWSQTYSGYGDNLALGTSAFGFINGTTYQNETTLSQYIKSVEENKLSTAMISNKSTYQQAMERTIALGFRRGFVEKKKFHQIYGNKIESVFSSTMDYWKQYGCISEDEKNIYLSELGRYHQSEISISFMNSTFNGISKTRKKMSIGRHIIPSEI